MGRYHWYLCIKTVKKYHVNTLHKIFFCALIIGGLETFVFYLLVAQGTLFSKAATGWSVFAS